MKKIILRVLGFIGVTLLMLVLCLYCVMWVVTKGPSEQARNLFVLSVRETSMAGFLANIYCSKAEIAAIEEGNKVKYLNEAVDTSLIKIDRDAAIPKTKNIKFIMIKPTQANLKSSRK